MPTATINVELPEDMYRRLNEFKGARRHAADPQDDRMVALFRPRLQQWNDHFAWSSDSLTVLGLTPTVDCAGQPALDTPQANRCYPLPH